MDTPTMKSQIQTMLVTMGMQANDVRGAERIQSTVDQLVNEYESLIAHLYGANHDIRNSGCGWCRQAKEIAIERNSR